LGRKEFIWRPVKKEDAMAAKRTLQLIVIVAILAVSCAATFSAKAGGNCATYVTVQWGDTLSGIAAYCGTTADALQAANPGLGWWLYAGQVLYIPNGYASAPAYRPPAGATYAVQWGDTLSNIALRNGYALSDVLAVNPQIWNINLIYPGQVINLPGAANVPYAYVPPAAYNPPPVAPTVVYPTPTMAATVAPPLPTQNVAGTPYVAPTLINPFPTPTALPTQFSVLRVIYGDGLQVRTGPSKEYSIIDDNYVDGRYGSNWWYRKHSAVVDAMGFTWVEVTLDPKVQTYKTGWMLAKDSAGKYYTLPHIDP
jgi:LysM repeat protein